MQQPNLLPILTGTLEKREEILFAYLFGSYAQGLQTPTSDVDVAVFFKTPPTFDRQLEIIHALGKALKGPEPDVLFLNEAKNLVLLDNVTREGLLLLDRDRERRLEFEVRVQHMAIDFRTQQRRIRESA